jgi:hypothetical protein
VNANVTRAYVVGCAAVSGLIIATAMGETATQEANSNPYSVISDRNVFRLNPAPPPVAVDTKPPDLRKVMLSGFQKVGSRMRVYLAIPAKDPKDTAYLALQAGEKESDVEIVTIRAEKQEVDIVNSGTPMTLTIASNGFQPTGGNIAKGGGAPPPPGPGAPERHHNGGLPGTPLPSVPGAGPAQSAARNSSILMGGGIGSGSSSFGSSAGVGSGYQGGASISGGAPAYAPPIEPGAPGVASQIANTLLGARPGQYQMPTPDRPSPPPVVQAAEMLVTEAAGGPPAPPPPEEQ